MSDDPTRRPPRRPSDDVTRRAGADADPTRRAAAPAGAEQPTTAGAPRPDLADDPLAALERLQSMGTAAAEQAPGKAAVAPVSRPGEDRPRRPRPRPAARAVSGLPLPRIVAPAVFLVAFIVFVSLLFHSGVLGGGSTTATSASNPPAATQSKNSGGSKSGSGSTTKVYVVKSGDTPSGIAAKYGITTADLEAMNPSKNFSTLIIGEKIKVPRQ